MNPTLALVTALFLSTSISGPAFAHTDEGRVSLALTDDEIQAQSSMTEKLSLLDVVTNRVLRPDDLEVTHEKKLHVFVFDEALQEFQHVHPEYIEGSSTHAWQVNLSLPRGGTYYVWAQGALAQDHQDFVADWMMKVDGGLPAHPVPRELGDVRTGADGNSRVSASSDRIVAKKMVMLNLRFDHVDGTTPALSPYLGAPAHVVAAPLGGGPIVHVHPMNGPTPNAMMLHAVFPRPGDYRLWVQFLDGGVLRVVPLSVRVVAG